MNVTASLRGVVGTSGLEPPTSRLSGARSNHLSYAPMWLFVFSYSLAFITCRYLLSRALFKLSLNFPEIACRGQRLVEMKGIEPLTPCLQGRCSPNWATPPCSDLFISQWTYRSLKIEQQSISTRPCVYLSRQSIFGFVYLNTRFFLGSISRSP